MREDSAAGRSGRRGDGGAKKAKHPLKEGNRHVIRFNVTNRFTGRVQFTAEIDCPEEESYSVKLGLAVKWAVKTGADLTGAYLAGAYLTDDDLTDTDLAGANLACANLTRANLTRANLTGADLTGADLTGANLTDAKGVELAIARTRILPEGDLIGWKNCEGGVIVKLRIPEDARRSHAFGRKCRAEFADVLEVIGAEVGISLHESNTEYRVGQRVTCDEWCDDWRQECAGGIHFFITRLEAENY